MKFEKDNPVYPSAFCVDIEVKSGKEKTILPWSEWCSSEGYTKLSENLRSGTYTEWRYKKSSGVSYRDHIKETLNKEKDARN